MLDRRQRPRQLPREAVSSLPSSVLEVTTLRLVSMSTGGTPVNVYRMSTDHGSVMTYPRRFRALSEFSADYHQQYLAKNPNGYCGIGGCGVPFKLAELQVGEQA